MDIEGVSMRMSQTQLMDAVGMKVLSMSLDMATQGAEGMVEMLEEMVPENLSVPNLGGNLDIKI